MVFGYYCRSEVIDPDQRLVKMESFIGLCHKRIATGAGSLLTGAIGCTTGDLISRSEHACVHDCIGII